MLFGVAFVVAVGTGGLPTAAFDSADASRSTDADVVSDPDAIHSLDVAPAVHINSTDPLVNVTNYFGQSVTVTVTLRDDSQHLGDLVVDGNNTGNESVFTLGETETKTVKIEIPDDSTLTTETVYFHVNGSARGLTVTAQDRSAPVDA